MYPSWLHQQVVDKDFITHIHRSPSHFLPTIQTFTLTRPEYSSPCDPADKGEAPRLKLGQRPFERLSRDRPDRWHANGPRVLYFQALPTASLDVKKPSGKEAKCHQRKLSPVQLHTEI